MIVVVMVTVCARDNLQKFLSIMLKLCLVLDFAYYAQFSAHLIMQRPTSGYLSLIKMCRCAIIHMASLQVNMGTWTPHYIKHNNSYHSLMIYV